MPARLSTDAFTFGWAAVATAAIIWLHSAQPTGYRIWQNVIVAAMTAFIGGIAIRTASLSPVTSR